MGARKRRVPDTHRPPLFLTRHRRLDFNPLRHIAPPLGGIGTGTISLGGKGDLRDWEIMNRQAKGFTQEHCFIALYCRREDGSAVARGLEGHVDPAGFNMGETDGASGIAANDSPVPRIL